jgi:hypothetical protein
MTRRAQAHGMRAACFAFCHERCSSSSPDHPFLDPRRRRGSSRARRLRPHPPQSQPAQPANGSLLERRGTSDGPLMILLRRRPSIVLAAAAAAAAPRLASLSSSSLPALVWPALLSSSQPANQPAPFAVADLDLDASVLVLWWFVGSPPRRLRPPRRSQIIDGGLARFHPNTPLAGEASWGAASVVCVGVGGSRPSVTARSQRLLLPNEWQQLLSGRPANQGQAPNKKKSTTAASRRAASILGWREAAGEIDGCRRGRSWLQAPSLPLPRRGTDRRQPKKNEAAARHTRWRAGLGRACDALITTHKCGGGGSMEVIDSTRSVRNRSDRCPHTQSASPESMNPTTSEITDTSQGPASRRHATSSVVVIISISIATGPAAADTSISHKHKHKPQAHAHATRHTNQPPNQPAAKQAKWGCWTSCCCHGWAAVGRTDRSPPSAGPASHGRTASSTSSC